MNQNSPTSARARQAPLRARYKEIPNDALIVDHSRSADGVKTDPFHGYVIPGSREYGIVWPFGIHSAVGGYHDGPNPGDLLCTALAACFDSTIRIVADRLGIVLTSLSVDVTGEVDVRGTLVVDPHVSVGFQRMRCRADIQPAPGTDAKLVEKLFAAAEYSCVVLQTLRAGVTVETSLNGGERREEAVGD